MRQPVPRSVQPWSGGSPQGLCISDGSMPPCSQRKPARRPSAFAGRGATHTANGMQRQRARNSTHRLKFAVSAVQPRVRQPLGPHPQVRPAHLPPVLPGARQGHRLHQGARSVRFRRLLCLCSLICPRACLLHGQSVMQEAQHLPGLGPGQGRPAIFAFYACFALLVAADKGKLCRLFRADVGSSCRALLRSTDDHVTTAAQRQGRWWTR